MANDHASLIQPSGIPALLLLLITFLIPTTSRFPLQIPIAGPNSSEARAALRALLNVLIRIVVGFFAAGPIIASSFYELCLKRTVFSWVGQDKPSPGLFWETQANILRIALTKPEDDKESSIRSQYFVNESISDYGVSVPFERQLSLLPNKIKNVLNINQEAIPKHRRPGMLKKNLIRLQALVDLDEFSWTQVLFCAIVLSLCGILTILGAVVPHTTPIESIAPTDRSKTPSFHIWPFLLLPVSIAALLDTIHPQPDVSDMTSPSEARKSEQQNLVLDQRQNLVQIARRSWHYLDHDTLCGGPSAPWNRATAKHDRIAEYVGNINTGDWTVAESIAFKKLQSSLLQDLGPDSNILIHLLVHSVTAIVFIEYVYLNFKTDFDTNSTWMWCYDYSLVYYGLSQLILVQLWHLRHLNVISQSRGPIRKGTQSDDDISFGRALVTAMPVFSWLSVIALFMICVHFATATRYYALKDHPLPENYIGHPSYATLKDRTDDVYAAIGYEILWLLTICFSWWTRKSMRARFESCVSVINSNSDVSYVESKKKTALFSRLLWWIRLAVRSLLKGWQVENVYWWQVQARGQIIKPYYVQDNKHGEKDFSLKLAIESLLRQRIVWWPLKEPRRPREAGTTRMSWSCECGVSISFDVQSAVISKASNHISKTASDITRTHNSGSEAIQGSALGTSTQSRTAPTNATARSNGSPKKTTTDADTSTNIFAHQDDPEQAYPDGYVYWCVDKSTLNTHVTEFIAREHTDKSLIAGLRSQYRSITGWWYRFWTMKTCSGVSFRQFRYLYDNRNFVVCKPKPELPDDPQYHFIKVDPLEEYRGWLEARLSHYIRDHANRSWPLVGGSKFLPSLGMDSCELLQRIPKKIPVPLEMREFNHGYGMQAVSNVSLVRLVLMLLLWQSGSVAFVIYWLCYHDGDLQNAFMVLTTTLAGFMLYLEILVRFGK